VVKIVTENERPPYVDAASTQLACCIFPAVLSFYSAKNLKEIFIIFRDLPQYFHPISAMA
jgi:hypothetical protein